MKKFITVLLPLVLGVACLGVFAGCDDKTPETPAPVIENVTDKEFTGWGTYTGELTDGKPTGTGKLVTAEYTYEGTFSGVFAVTGEGVLTYTSGEANGDVSRGTFVQGKLEGYGVKEFKNSGCIGIGYYKNNLLNGKGYFCWPQDNGAWDWYYGDWENMVRKGTGIYQFNNGCWYTGEFNDWINGEGTFHWTNGNFWTGTFEGGSPKKGNYGYGQMDGVKGYILADATDGHWSWYNGTLEDGTQIVNGQPVEAE